MKLSIIIPVYNEKGTIREILERVKATPYPKEIIVVDDGSTDGTSEILSRLASADEASIRVVYHRKNMGKGAAFRTGFSLVTGNLVIIQDADLEYDPRDYPKLLKPILEGQADVVYGSRLLPAGGARMSFWHYFVNRMLTLLSNMLTNLHLADMETCYKAFRTCVLRRINIRSNRFGVEPELTAKVARMRLRICEVPISYKARSYTEGKKISWKDGLAAVFHIVRFKFCE